MLIQFPLNECCDINKNLIYNIKIRNIEMIEFMRKLNKKLKLLILIIISGLNL